MKRSLLLLILLISACVPTANRVNSVLTMSECKLPCWGGITPGVTTAEEAKQILESTEGIGADNVRGFYQLLEIHFSLFMETPGINRKTLGWIESSGGIVTELRLTENLNIAFDDIVQQLGEPEYVISAPFIGGGNVFVVVYPAKGVSFDAPYDIDVVDSETEITSLTLFDPTDYNRLLDERVFSEFDAQGTKKIMYSWKGYGNIDELYPPRIP